MLESALVNSNPTIVTSFLGGNLDKHRICFENKSSFPEVVTRKKRRRREGRGWS